MRMLSKRGQIYGLLGKSILIGLSQCHSERAKRSDESFADIGMIYGRKDNYRGLRLPPILFKSNSIFHVYLRMVSGELLRYPETTFAAGTPLI